jgi:hypothetical protein
LYPSIDFIAGSKFPTPGRTSPSKDLILSILLIIKTLLAPFLSKADFKLKRFPDP